jgi:5'-nucleotidase
MRGYVMAARKRVLITNDDGVASEGIRRLALVARELGLDVVVAAPQHESSGCSAGLTAVEADGRIVVDEHKLAGLDGVPVYGVAALPAFIALIGTRGAFGKAPDLILSGINRGPNTGHAILHSGTVGAALTAVSNGCPAMAVSLDVGDEWQWDTAAEVAATALPLLLEAHGPVVLNVNVPPVPLDEIRGLRTARLASFGAVQTNISEVGEGYVGVSIEDIDADVEPGTDVALLAEGYATITPLQPVCESTLRLRNVEWEPRGSNGGADSWKFGGAQTRETPRVNA